MKDLVFRPNVNAWMIGGLAVWLTAASPAGALERPPQVPVIGFGSASCSEYLHAVSTGRVTPYTDWLSGYFTAINIQRNRRIVSVRGLDQVLRFAREHCTKHPAGYFMQGIIEFTQIATRPPRTDLQGE